MKKSPREKGTKKMSTQTKTTKAPATRKPRAPRVPKAAAPVAKIASPLDPWMLRPGVTMVVAGPVLHDFDGHCLKDIQSLGETVKDRAWLESAWDAEIESAAHHLRTQFFCERCVIARKATLLKVIETKAERDATVATLLAGIKAHAVEHYGEAGWDYVIEAWDDDQLADMIGRARTLDGAIKKVAIVASEMNDRRAEIQNA